MSANSSALPGDTAGTRAERLLSAMHKVFSHDLPNQLVVVQSLASLLVLEEGDQLGEQGREYVSRLQSACSKASELVDFLKQMARVQRLSEPVGVVQLNHFAREVQAELGRLFPQHRFTWELNWQVPALRAGMGALHQSVVALLRAGVHFSGEQSLRVALGTQAEGSQVGLHGAVGSLDTPGWILTRPILPGDVPANALPEVVLACELTATWGGTLSGPSVQEGVWHFRIHSHTASE